MTAVCAAVVIRWWDVLDEGDRWQAVCARCRWEADPRTNPVYAKRDAKQHTQGEDDV